MERDFIRLFDTKQKKFVFKFKNTTESKIISKWKILKEYQISLFTFFIKSSELSV